MRVSSALRCWLGAALLSACGDATATDSQYRATATLHGSITSSKTARGVPNLLVALMREGRVLQVAVTDSTGIFRLPGAPSGDVSVHVTGLELAGLDSRLTALEPPRLDIRVDQGESRELFFAAVGLVPPQIVGVLRCGGTPVSGASIRVIGGPADVVVETNMQGKYAANSLHPGHYAVIAVSAPCAVAPAWAAVEVLPGQTATVDFGS